MIGEAAAAPDHGLRPSRPTPTGLCATALIASALSNAPTSVTAPNVTESTPAAPASAHVDTPGAATTAARAAALDMGAEGSHSST